MVLEETVVDKKLNKWASRVKDTPKSGNLVELCSGSVVWFAEKMLGFELATWQVKFLSTMQDSLEGKRFNITAAMTSRQIGKSTSVAIFALWASLFNKKPAGVFSSTNTVIVSRDFGSAKKLLRDVKVLYRLGDSFMRHKYVDADGNPLFGFFESDGKYVGLFSSLISKDDPNNATMITFETYDDGKHGQFLLKGSKSGSSIICLAPTPSVLGNTFSIGIVDEAAHEDIRDDFWEDELAPTGDSTNAMWVFISTPWQPQGFFFEHIDPMDEYGSSSFVNRLSFSIDALKNDPSERARKQYANVMKKIQEQYESKGKLAAMRRAYYCEFVRGDDNFFDPEKVETAFDSSVTPLDSFSGLCDLGVDFGGAGKSHTVLTVSSLDDEGVIHRLWHKRYPVDEDRHNQILHDIGVCMKKFNIQRIIVDDCPSGRYLIHDMEQNKSWDVTRFVFRKDKLAKFAAFKEKLYNGLVVSYTDQDLRVEMKMLQNSKESRQSKITAARGYTDDLIDSWIISCYHFLEDESVSYSFFSSKGRWS